MLDTSLHPGAQRLRPECVQYAAFVEGGVSALLQETLERRFERPEVGDLGSYLMETCGGHPIHLCTRRVVRSLRKGEKPSHGLERKTELARLPNEQETLKMMAIIDSMSSRAAARLGQHPDLLVIADGHHLAPSESSQRSDRKDFTHALEPIAARGPIDSGEPVFVKAESWP